MSWASVAIVMLAAAAVRPVAPVAHSHSLAEGRSVVQSMLIAIEQKDLSAFDRVVAERALVVIGDAAAPLELQIPPAELGCANPKVAKVEPSENIVGDSRVTVAWACKPRLPDFDGKMTIKFWVHGGKVIFGERV